MSTGHVGEEDRWLKLIHVTQKQCVHNMKVTHVILSLTEREIVALTAYIDLENLILLN